MLVRPSHALTKLPAVTIIISSSATADFDRGSIFGRGRTRDRREDDSLLARSLAWETGGRRRRNLVKSYNKIGGGERDAAAR